MLEKQRVGTEIYSPTLKIAAWLRRFAVSAMAITLLFLLTNKIIKNFIRKWQENICWHVSQPAPFKNVPHCDQNPGQNQNYCFIGIKLTPYPCCLKATFRKIWFEGNSIFFRNSYSQKDIILSICD